MSMWCIVAFNGESHLLYITAESSLYFLSLINIFGVVYVKNSDLDYKSYISDRYRPHVHIREFCEKI